MSPSTPLPLATRKRGKLNPEDEKIFLKKSKKIQKKYDERKMSTKISHPLEELLQQGKHLAWHFTSRPGQCGGADGYVLKGKTLEFYLREIESQKGK